MNVLHLDIAGQSQVPVAFNILAFRKFCEAYDVEFEDMGEVLERKGVMGLTDVIYFGHLAYCSLHGMQPQINRDQSTMFAEGADEHVMGQVQNAIYNAKIMGKTLNEIRQENEQNGTAEDGKKKPEQPKSD